MVQFATSRLSPASPLVVGSCEARRIETGLMLQAAPGGPVRSPEENEALQAAYVASRAELARASQPDSD